MAARTSPRFALTTARNVALDAETPGRLIAYLRRAMDEPTIAYAEPPSPISGGFDTTIFAFSLAAAPPGFEGPLIVRIFRAERDAGHVTFESAVQRAVSATGFPVPPVLVTELDERALGGAFLIMPRVPGRIMLSAFFGPGVRHTPALFGRTHAALHALDPEVISARVQADGASGADLLHRSSELAWLRECIERARLSGLLDCLGWLVAHHPNGSAGRRVLCHGDFHPLNILIDDSGRNVTGVIDWAGARIADPAWDVGATVALMTQGPIDVPAAVYPAMAFVRRRVVAAYLRAYQRLLPLDLQAVRYYEALRCLGFAVEVGEKHQMRAGFIPEDSRSSAFEQPHVVSRVFKRLKDITGVAASLP
jgi:aminoglycoside phosphotransferase (APT) family kinase protein